MKRERVAHIYALIDPRNGKACYVGSTYNVDLRWNTHMKETEFRKLWPLSRLTPKQVWLRELVEAGLEPGIQILESCASSERGEREDWWVNHLRQAGAGLTNKRKAGAKAY